MPLNLKQQRREMKMEAGGRNKEKQREPREGNSSRGLVTALNE